MITISAISSAHAASAAENQKPTSDPKPSQSPAARLPNDTVTLSPAAHRASQAGDAGHDGDSH